MVFSSLSRKRTEGRLSSKSPREDRGALVYFQEIAQHCAGGGAGSAAFPSVNAWSICTTLRWRLMIVAYLLGADGARVVSDVDA